MTLRENLIAACKNIFYTQWTSVKKTIVPEATDLQLGNHAGCFDEMAVLYADLNGSTDMVDEFPWELSAEVYKSYLHCAAKIIKSNGGVITAYDGDRIMAVFIGDSKNSDAVTAALEINYALKYIVNPTFNEIYAARKYVIKHTIGIDVSPIRVARIGVKNDNDLVWVGRAANHAAKLTSIVLPDFPIRVSNDVYKRLKDKLKPVGKNLWTWKTSDTMNDKIIWGTDAFIYM